MTTADNGMPEIKEYDNRGNEIHYRDSDGYEVWWEYDKNNNVIHYRTCDGYEVWWEYDEKGNVIFRKESDSVVDTPQDEWTAYDGYKDKP